MDVYIYPRLWEQSGKVNNARSFMLVRGAVRENRCSQCSFRLCATYRVDVKGDTAQMVNILGAANFGRVFNL